jgi:hypothetical protein
MRRIDPSTPGDDMGPTLTLAETARIEALLSRLDPEAGTCRVPGCTHAQHEATTREDVPALAA